MRARSPNWQSLNSLYVRGGLLKIRATSVHQCATVTALPHVCMSLAMQEMPIKHASPQSKLASAQQLVFALRAADEPCSESTPPLDGPSTAPRLHEDRNRVEEG